MPQDTRPGHLRLSHIDTRHCLDDVTSSQPEWLILVVRRTTTTTRPHTAPAVNTPGLVILLGRTRLHTTPAPCSRLPTSASAPAKRTRPLLRPTRTTCRPRRPVGLLARALLGPGQKSPDWMLMLPMNSNHAVQRDNLQSRARPPPRPACTQTRTTPPRPSRPTRMTARPTRRPAPPALLPHAPAAPGGRRLQRHDARVHGTRPDDRRERRCLLPRPEAARHVCQPEGQPSFLRLPRHTRPRARRRLFPCGTKPRPATGTTTGALSLRGTRRPPAIDAHADAYLLRPEAPPGDRLPAGALPQHEAAHAHGDRRKGRRTPLAAAAGAISSRGMMPHTHTPRRTARTPTLPFRGPLPHPATDPLVGVLSICGTQPPIANGATAAASSLRPYAALGVRHDDRRPLAPRIDAAHDDQAALRAATSLSQPPRSSNSN